MGHPRKQRRKYSGPSHPWKRDRLESEAVLKKKYGLKNKKEIWKIDSLLRKFKQQAKRIIAGSKVKGREEQCKKEQEQLLTRLVNLGVLSGGSKIEEVLDLPIEKLMERRLQTMVVTKGLARKTKQARQFVVHQHILVNNQTINVPSYLVKKAEEDKITFNALSSLQNPDHPERKVEQKGVVEVKETKAEEKPAEAAVEVAA